MSKKNTLKKLKNLAHEAVIYASNDQVSPVVMQRLTELAKKVKVKGFRSGKSVPINIVKQRYGVAVTDEVAADVMHTNLMQLIAKENLRLAGPYSIKSKDTNDTDIKFEISFEVLPEIKLANLKKVKVHKPVVEITDEDINRMIEKLQKQQANWQEKDTAAEVGDKLTIDFEGTIKGKPFSGGKGDNMSLILGENQFIAGFEEGLVRKKIGDDVTLKIKFPKDYHKADLAAKPVVFAVKITKVETPILPKLDDDFAKIYGVKSGGIKTLEEEIKTNLAREAKQKLEQVLKERVMDQLSNLNKVMIPRVLLDKEIDQLHQKIRDDHKKATGSDELPIDIDHGEIEKTAEKRVALGLIVAQLVNDFNIKCDPDQLKKFIQEVAQTYQEPERFVNWCYQNKDQLSQFEGYIIEKTVVDTVMEKATVKEKKGYSYHQLMEEK